MIWWIPWPPGARDEWIRIPPVPLGIIFHISEGEGGKHYKPYKMFTFSLSEAVKDEFKAFLLVCQKWKLG